ncbi:MAG: dihydroorotase, partial [Planctomycetota bacterium]
MSETGRQVLRGATVSGRGVIDVAISEGKISAISPSIEELEGDVVVDTGGKHLVPGLIDVQVND